jgi:hypothetical protein
MRTQDQLGERNTLRKTFRSSDGCTFFRVSFYEYNSSLPDHPTRHCPFCSRRAEAIGTNHGVLDISTIDASSCRAHAACFLSHVTEGFADEQSPATLTEHISSFCFLCRSYVSLTWVQRRQSRLSPSSAIAFGFPPTLRTRPWTGRRSDTDAAPGLSRCSTPPKPLNHIHSRRPDLYGGGLGTTEPLGRSRCCLLLVLVSQRVSPAVCREDRLQSGQNCSGWKN